MQVFFFSSSWAFFGKVDNHWGRPEECEGLLWQLSGRGWKSQMVTRVSSEAAETGTALTTGNKYMWNVLSQTLNRHPTDVSSLPFPLPPWQASSQIPSAGPGELRTEICPLLGSLRGEVMVEVCLVAVVKQARVLRPRVWAGLSKPSWVRIDSFWDRCRAVW